MGKLVQHTVVSDVIRAAVNAHSSKPLNSASRANVLGTDDEHNAIHEAKRMMQHELFHFTIVLSAPVTAGQKGPADLDFARSGIIGMK